MDDNREVFVFVTNEGAQITLDAQALRRWVLANTDKLTLYDIPLDGAIAVHFLDENAVDPLRILSMTDAELVEPIIFCEWPEANGTVTHILADGRHRYVKKTSQGHKTIEARIIPPLQWLPFLISDVPNVTIDQLRAIPPMHLPRKKD